VDEFWDVISADLEPPFDALWARRVWGWAQLSRPAKRCYLECALQDVLEEGPLSREEVERLDSRRRRHYFHTMLVWVRCSGMEAVRRNRLEARQTILDELESLEAPRKVFLSWRNRYGAE
jgi:hypothetical protein